MFENSTHAHLEQ